jgi:hypothetical protein
MPGLDLEVAVHRLSIDPTVKPVKQAQRRMNPVRSIPVNTEVDKMETAGLIEPCDYSSWLSNIVVVRKKSGQIRVCVDLRDVNKGFILSFSNSRLPTVSIGDASLPTASRPVRAQVSLTALLVLKFVID